MSKTLQTTCLLLIAVAMQPRPAAAAQADMPRLIVVISIDQFPFEYLERMKSGFSEQGMFLRVAAKGANYVQCHHRHAFTLTGPGHSVLLTGAFPNVTGIVGNDWFDRQRNRDVYCCEDNEAPLVGLPKVGTEGGISPRNLLVDTVCDVLRLRTGHQAKVFGVALKDRAAVLMAGHAANGAYWYSNSGNWITSSYYHKELPPYMVRFNESNAAEAYVGKSWDLLQPRDKYTHYRPDDSPLEGNTPIGRAFPHVLPDKANADYFKAMPFTPFGSEMTLAAARMILTEEGLGQDDVPDILAINLSSNDYIGHTFGPYSLEVQDMTLRTDRMLGEFADFVERQLGGKPWTLFISSDHGVGPIPEYAAAMGIPAVRNPLGKLKEFQASLDEALKKRLGDPGTGKSLVRLVDENSVYLADSVTSRPEEYAAAQRAVRDLLLENPAIAAAATREELQGGADSPKIVQQFRRSFNPKRSGDVLFALRPYYLQTSLTASHGSPWTYDSHVALLALGAGIKQGRFTTPTSPAAIAPTVARLLNVEEPAACAEKPLAEALEELPASK